MLPIGRMREFGEALAAVGHWLDPARSRYALGQTSRCHHAAEGHLAQQLTNAPARAQADVWLDFDLAKIFAEIAVAMAASLHFAA
jgi:hypothetical protein